jgi:hypothetical protein
MRSRLTLCVLLCLSCVSPAAAQLASQTALVGTVTDGAGSVVPGASVVAVSIGTKDTYETTTTAEGYYNIQFVRTRRPIRFRGTSVAGATDSSSTTTGRRKGT